MIYLQESVREVFSVMKNRDPERDYCCEGFYYTGQCDDDCFGAKPRQTGHGICYGCQICWNYIVDEMTPEEWAELFEMHPEDFKE